jgi:ankyrin repeat protein
MAAVDILLAMGERGMRALAVEFNNDREAADLLAKYWQNVDETVKKTIKEKEVFTFPLHMALEKGFTDVAELFILKSANIITQDSEDRLPIHLAAENGHRRIVELLLKHYEDLGSPACPAPKRDHLYPIQDISSEAIKCLIDDGSMINAQDEDGNTPFHKAAAGGHEEVAALLIAEGAKLDARNFHSGSAIHYAAKSGNGQLIKLLIDKGLSARDRTRYWKHEPLHMASSRDAVETLVEAGADVNAVASSDTPLVTSVVAKREVAGALIENGADVNAEGVSAIKPLHSAILEQRADLVRLFVEKGADVNYKLEGKMLRKYSTPLHAAMREDSINIAEFLIENGADVNIKNNEGKTPLELARSTPMKSLLRSHGGKTGEELRKEAEKK